MKKQLGPRITIVALLLGLLLSACGTFEIEQEPALAPAEPAAVESGGQQTTASSVETSAASPAVETVEPSPTVEVEAQSTPENQPASSWQTYENRAYGFAFTYPADWTAAEVDDADFVGPGSRSVQFSQGSITLVVGYRQLGQETPLAGSGAPAGELVDSGSVEMGGQQVPKSVLVYEDQDKAVFYGLPDPITVGNLQFAPRLDDFRPDYEAVDLPPAIQAEADEIISSLTLLESGSAGSESAAEHDYGDWSVYRNDSMGYMLMHPPNTDVMGADPAAAVEFVGPVVGSEHWPWLTVQHYDSEFYHPPSGTDVRQYIAASVAEGRMPSEPLVEELTIGGVPAVHVQVSASPQAYGRDEYYFIRGEQLFQIIVLHTDGQSHPELTQQFLDSFSFQS